MRALLLVCLLIWGMILYAQDPIDTEIRQLEDILELSEDNEGFDYDNILENIDFYSANPLDLNEVTEIDLLALGILSQAQVQSILRHREIAGEFIAVYELQAVAGISLEMARFLSQLFVVGKQKESTDLPLFQRFKDGEHLLFLRWSRNLEEQKGFIQDEEGQARFEGNPDKLFLRYRYRFSNTLSYGVTAEKDPGESFFGGSNPQGFDFYSAHLWWRKDQGLVRQVSLGDFAVSFGEGLVIHTDFGYGKSGAIRDIKKNFRKIRPYTSVAENNFLRGAVIQLQPHPQIECTLFGSYRFQDGNFQEVDTLTNQDARFTSLQITGLHRTESEIEDEGSVRYLSYGGHLEYDFGSGYMGVTALVNRFEPSFQPNPAPERLFAFAGEQLQNFGYNYSYFLKSTHFFGEVAYSDPGGWATLHGMMSSLSRTIDLGVFYRYYSREYQSLWANGIGEGANTTNEEGLYIGIEARPNESWHLQAYADIWKNPWLRFRVNGPSTGNEYLLRLSYEKRKYYEAYIRFRVENNWRTQIGNDGKVDQIFPTTRTQLRGNIDYKILPGLRLRNRIEYSWWQMTGAPSERGVLILQDVIYKPPSSAWSGSLRYALFDTDGWESRIYAFENDLIYNFSIPPYSGRGSRYYLNLRYKVNRNLTVEGRYAQWFFNDREVINDGSVLEIEGNRRTEVKFQVRYNFR